MLRKKHSGKQSKKLKKHHKKARRSAVIEGKQASRTPHLFLHKQTLCLTGKTVGLFYLGLLFA